MKYELIEIIRFISLMKVELYCLLIVFSALIQGVTITQLMEDKICCVQLQLPAEACTSMISSVEPEIGGKHRYKADHDVPLDKMLQGATRLWSYQNMIVTPPFVLTSLAIGRWTQSYPGHIKIILSLPCISGIIQTSFLILNTIFFDWDPKWLLVSFITSGFLGSSLCALTGANTYIAWTITNQHTKLLRFIFIEVFVMIGNTLGTILGGYILTSTPWFSNKHSNYLGVFLVALTTQVSALLWIILMLPPLQPDVSLDLKPEPVCRLNKSDDDKVLPIQISKGSSQCNRESKSIDIPQPSDHRSPEMSKPSLCQFLRNVFSPSALKDLFSILVRSRPFKGCLVLNLLITAMVIVKIMDFAGMSIDFQFCQHVYSWDARSYAAHSALLSLIPSLVSLVIPSLLVQFGFNHIMIGLLGSASLFAKLLIRGIILTPIGYVSSYLVGCLSKISPAAFRSIICCTVEPSEVGGIFAIMTSLESVARIIASLSFSPIFNATLRINPGITFCLAAVLTIFPFFALIYCHFYQKSVDKKNQCIRRPTQGTVAVLSIKPL